MEKIEIIYKEIKDKLPNNFARERVLKELGVRYEYLVEGAWIPGPPPQKPQNRRVVFEPAERYAAANDVYQAWLDLDAKKAYSPEKPEEIIARFVAARVGERSLTIFVPWGVRMEGKFGPELLALDIVNSEVELLEERAIKTQTLLMPADLYATQVNRRSPTKAMRYFDKVAEEAAKRSLAVKPWSLIRAENTDFYSQRIGELTDNVIDNMLSVPVLYSAKKAAKRRSGYTDVYMAEQAAYAYLRERVVEAEITEAQYKPVKFSMVFKNKDNEVDRDLPRVYIIPERLQAPWLIT